MTDKPKTLDEYEALVTELRGKYDEASSVANRVLLENIRLRAVLTAALDDLLPLLKKHHGEQRQVSEVNLPPPTMRVDLREPFATPFRDFQAQRAASVPAFRATKPKKKSKKKRAVKISDYSGGQRLERRGDRR